MVTAIVVAILLLVIVLASIGAYIVVHGSNHEKDKEEISKIAMSGKYAAAMRPVADLLAEKKPGKTEIEEWLTSHCSDKERKNELIENWQDAINETIKIINEGDLNGVTAYRINFGPKDSKVCPFLHLDHFITREQINKNAELLPPYYFGSDSVVVPKLPWENSDGTGWKSVTPKDGQYDVPDWRQIV